MGSSPELLTAPQGPVGRPSGDPLAKCWVSTGPEGRRLHHPPAPSTHTGGPPRDSSGSPGGAAGPNRGGPGAQVTQESPWSNTTADPASRRGETHSPQSPLSSTAAAPPLRPFSKLGEALRGAPAAAEGRTDSEARPQRPRVASNSRSQRSPGRQRPHRLSNPQGASWHNLKILGATPKRINTQIQPDAEQSLTTWRPSCWLA
ncbi:hypothetical protein NDU88_003761 [Pleurodeles waltl]|uniref:Uncharacterized protein n=1 Tax=Pleurodeles waltl TaxID=8319 RepID=A0AAV7TQM4_PLEWA|nr:hypothetical protein NDU88_003761 [Pleurodeles waltl]